jgi:hypothetical protein
MNYWNKTPNFRILLHFLTRIIAFKVNLDLKNINCRKLIIDFQYPIINGENKKGMPQMGHSFL